MLFEFVSVAFFNKCTKMLFELAPIANVPKQVFEENEKDQNQDHIAYVALGQGGDFFSVSFSH